MTPRLVQRDASPYQVASSCVRQARKFASPRYRTAVYHALGPYLPWPNLQEGDGAPIPYAMARLAQDIRRYREPVDLGEIVADPITTLAVMAGDCDDAAVVVAWLARSLGFTTAIALYPAPGGAHVAALVSETWSHRPGQPAPLRWHIDQRGIKTWPGAQDDPARAAIVLPVP